MTIINGCERFAWEKKYWVNDGYGKIERNGKSKSAPSLSYSSKITPQTNAVKIVNDALERITMKN
jgi:hypothetical protein